jgi:hypothetical protein
MNKRKIIPKISVKNVIIGIQQKTSYHFSINFEPFFFNKKSSK